MHTTPILFQLGTIQDCFGNVYLTRTITDDAGTEYLIADQLLVAVVSEDDALDRRIAYYMRVDQMIALTDTECLELINL
jgi:hypothetical protein